MGPSRFRAPPQYAGTVALALSRLIGTCATVPFRVAVVDPRTSLGEQCEHTDARSGQQRTEADHDEPDRGVQRHAVGSPVHAQDESDRRR